jgi:hypothetical protein
MNQGKSLNFEIKNKSDIKIIAFLKKGKVSETFNSKGTGIRIWLKFLRAKCIFSDIFININGE